MKEQPQNGDKPNPWAATKKDVEKSRATTAKISPPGKCLKPGTHGLQRGTK